MVYSAKGYAAFFYDTVLATLFDADIEYEYSAGYKPANRALFKSFEINKTSDIMDNFQLEF